MCQRIGMAVVDVQDPDDKVGNGFAVVFDVSEPLRPADAIPLVVAVVAPLSVATIAPHRAASCPHQ